MGNLWKKYKYSGIYKQLKTIPKQQMFLKDK